MLEPSHVKWGRRAAFAVVVPGLFLLIIAFGGLMMAGGGCEGRPQPCTPDYRHVWASLAIIVAAVVAASLAAYYAASFVARSLADRRGNG